MFKKSSSVLNRDVGENFWYPNDYKSNMTSVCSYIGGWGAFFGYRDGHDAGAHLEQKWRRG